MLAGCLKGTPNLLVHPASLRTPFTCLRGPSWEGCTCGAGRLSEERSPTAPLVVGEEVLTMMGGSEARTDTGGGGP